jgi:hypothetical protein
MREEKEVPKEERLINPISGEPVDESISELEAKKKGYLELEFLMKHLEDENEYVKFLLVDNRKVIVHMRNPMTQYKKKTNIDYSRVLQEVKEKEKVDKLSPVPVNSTCSIDNKEECLSCSG